MYISITSKPVAMVSEKNFLGWHGGKKKKPFKEADLKRTPNLDSANKIKSCCNFVFYCQKKDSSQLIHWERLG